MVSLHSSAGECPHAVTTSGAPMKRAIVAFTIFGGAAVAQAQEPPRPLEIQPPQSGTEAPGAPPIPQAILEPVVVSAPPPADSSSEQVIPGKDFELRPQGRPADILRLVPGFVVSQHQGGGKAAQYFLRGFDADHGTDAGFFLDNMPINLRSHAHGQGYTDLHFMIPETLKQVDVFKGPYWVEYGDFSTAAAVNFMTRDIVPEDIVQAAGGNWGTQRYLTLFSPTRERVKTLFAVEIYKTNGPFDRPQDYQRINGFVKASGWLSESVQGSIWASYLWSHWWASGQIPERAVREKIIDRFGAIDNSEGGNTQRFNLNGNLQWCVTDNDTARVRAFAQYYQLDLYSNFTFFLNDPVNGDEIGQFDRNRKVAGMNAEYEHRDTVLGVPLTTTAGFQFRPDRPNVLLTHTVDRNLLDTTQNMSIFETSYAPFVKFEAQPLPWLHVLTGARGDFFYFNVQHPTSPRAARASPSPAPRPTSSSVPGLGPSSSPTSARAITATMRARWSPIPTSPPCPGHGLGVRGEDADPAQDRADLHLLVAHPDQRARVQWGRGTVEPSGASRRQGFEFGVKLRPFDWLTYTGNVTQTTAEFFNGNAVPLAPRVTAFSDLTARFPWGLEASVSMRYLGNRYADEFRFQTARGYTLYEAGARYRYQLGGTTFLDAFVNIENILNVDWREAQFYNTSRLRGEPVQGVNDINYTPGNPRTVMGGLALRF